MTHEQLFRLTKKRLLDEGWTAAAAERQAREFASIHDIVVVDPETGEEHVYLGPDKPITREDGGDGDGNGVSKNVSRQKNRRASEV